MDFSTEFVAFRDRMLAGQDKAFTVQMSAQVAGRMAASFSSFRVDSERKLLGLVPLGNTNHAHEYRLLFAVPELDAQSLQDWWKYAEAAERELVKPDRAHEFSIVSIILVTEKLDRTVPKKLKKLMGGRDFSNIGRGWSSVRMAVIDLAERKIHVSRTGDPLKNVLKPFL